MTKNKLITNETMSIEPTISMQNPVQNNTIGNQNGEVTATSNHFAKYNLDSLSLEPLLIT